MVKTSIGNYLLNNLNNGIEDDILELISSDEKTLKIHKCVARKSNLLNLLITNTDKDEIIQVKLKYNNNILNLVRDYLYLDFIKLTTYNFKDLFELSDYLSIDDLFILIVEWIFTYNLTIYNSISIFRLIKSSSLNSSKYMEKINKFIYNNLSKIILKSEIYLLQNDEYINLLKDEDLKEITIFESIKLWLNKVKNKKDAFEIFSSKNIIIPGLLDSHELWHNYFPYLESLGIKISADEKIDILELSNFKSQNRFNYKYDYNKYLWATNLEIKDSIDFKNSLFNWTTAEIYGIKILKNINKYLNKYYLKIKYDNTNETIIIPNDIYKIDKLHKYTVNWLNDLKIGSNLIYDLSVICEVVLIIDEDLLIYSDNEFYYKLSINSKKISQSNKLTKYNNYLEKKELNIAISTDLFNLLEYDTKYTKSELEKL